MTHFLFRNTRRQRWLRTAGWRTEAALLYLFWLTVRQLPVEQASATGRRVFTWLGPHTRQQQRIMHNLSTAFPGLACSQLEALARDSWGNFGSVLAEYPHLEELADGCKNGAVELQIDPVARGLIQDGNPAIYISAHIGNWELAASAIASLGVPLSVVYAPQGNPVVERMLQSRRRALGCRFIRKQNALRELVREIRKGRSVGMLPDQRMDSGVSLPFFGRTTPSPTTPAWLALHTGSPLIPVHIERSRNARYRAEFQEPIVCGGAPATRANILRITTSINHLFENWIRRHPEQWLCIKRRWPKAVYKPSHTMAPAITANDH